MTEQATSISTSAAIPSKSALESGFPAAVLSELATKESWRKEVHRPATSTHKWWAKRLGTVFRGIIVAAATPADGDALAAYSSPTILNGLTVFDPFSGSGVTGVEALKLGANAICFDINPVATLVERQAIQNWNWQALRDVYSKVEASCRREIDRVHRTQDGRTVLYYFWVATVNCPTCKVRINLFDSTIFSKNAYPKRVPKAQIVCPGCLDIQEGVHDFESVTCANGHQIQPRGPVDRSVATCSNGHECKVIPALAGKIPHYEMYAKMVVDARGVKTYEGATDWDRDLYRECEELVRNIPRSSVLPSGSLAAGNNTKQALNWNFNSWQDFFNARQLYSLSLIATAVRDLPRYTPEREAISALFSGTLEFNNRFTSFKGEGTGAVRHMFSHHILKPERVPLEAHPWGTPYSSGSFSTLLDSRLRRAHEYKERPFDIIKSGDELTRVAGVGMTIDPTLCTDWLSFDASEAQAAYVATCSSAITDLPDASVDLVVTDPPYMDNVHYAELADFFHAWLREIRPFESYSTEDSTRRVGEVQHADPKEFGKAISAVWTECARVLKAGGIVAFTFHQARISGWINLIESLDTAGLCVTAVQPVKGEMATSVVKSGSREPSNLDSVVVCRRKVDGAVNPHKSVEAALQTARREISALIDAGITVGAGDVRSVVRGSMLAHLISTGSALEHETENVDKRASELIAALLGDRLQTG